MGARADLGWCEMKTLIVHSSLPHEHKLTMALPQPERPEIDPSLSPPRMELSLRGGTPLAPAGFRHDLPSRAGELRDASVQQLA
jgi:hypothetical protein